MLKIGDKIVFRYEDPKNTPHPNEYLDFRECIIRHTNDKYDEYVWNCLFNRGGEIYAIISGYNNSSIKSYFIKTDNFGIVEAPIKAIKLKVIPLLIGPKTKNESKILLGPSLAITSQQMLCVSNDAHTKTTKYKIDNKFNLVKL